MLCPTASDTTTMAATCTDCNAPLGRSLIGSVFWLLSSPNDFGCENPKKTCTARLCSTCHLKRPLMMTAGTSTDNQTDDKTSDGLGDATLKCLCQACFQDCSTLDWSKTFDVIEGSSDFCFVFAHGGGASRQLFKYHAIDLEKQFGHSSILLDLPGHGTLVDTTLTLDAVADTVQSVLQQCQSLTQNKKLLYVGASFGAYTGFHVLKKLNGTFCGAMQWDCGQNVGPGCSLKAKAGLVMLNYLGEKMSNATLMKLMAKEMTKSTSSEWYHLRASTFGSGMFFDQGGAQVACLRSVAPAEILPDIHIPIVYMNGTEDHRDSEDKWLQVTQQNGKKGSYLKVYEGGDHFFTHDTRFVQDILNRMDAFAKTL